MQIKTTTTVAGVNEIDFGNDDSQTTAHFYWIKNLSDSTLYVSTKSNPVAGADNVAELSAKGAASVETDEGKVYVLGAGKVEIHRTNSKFCPFELPSTGSGGGGGSITVDSELSETSTNPLQNKATTAAINEIKSDIKTLKANSKPNLLINPDFRINQRGISGTFSNVGKYFVDRWRLVSGTVTVNSDSTLTLNGSICQPLENAVGANVITSVSAGTAVYDDTTQTFTITGNGDVISWVKLEYGNATTAFIPPDPATELMKCMRYYEKIVCSNNMYNVACQYFNNLKDASFAISMMPKRVKTPTSMIDYSVMTYVNSENLAKVSSAYANEYTVNSVSIVATLSTPTTVCTHGWVVDFTIEIDAEIY